MPRIRSRHNGELADLRHFGREMFSWSYSQFDKKRTSDRLGRQPARAKGAAAATVKLDVILVDTSVWVDHLRARDKALAALLDTGAVLAHSFVIGEMALGDLRQREIVLNALSDLPQASAATDRGFSISSSVKRCSGAGLAMSTPIYSRRCN